MGAAMSTVQVARSASLVQVTATRPIVAVGTPSVVAHNALTNRSDADAHPTSAITGLDAALALKATLASPALTGTPTAPTAVADTGTTQIATTAFAKGEADAAQAYAIQRANHTGTQPAATISDFSTSALAATAAAYDPAGSAAAAQAASQPLDANLTAIAALTTTAYGRGFLPLADAAAALTHIGAQAAGSYQPLDSDLTAIAALTTTAYGRGALALADAAAFASYSGIPLLATSGITGALTLTKSGTTARTATFPDAAIMVAGTNFAQTWTAAQSFTTGTTTISTADINGGAIDGTVIGAAAAAAITCTTLTTSSNVGIGTSPGATLDVLAGATGRWRYSTDGTTGSYLDFLDAGATAWEKSTIRATQISLLAKASGAPVAGLVLTESGAAFAAGVTCTTLAASSYFGCNGATPAAPMTGYGTPTNGAVQGSFDATSITLPNLAAAVAKLILDLKATGLVAA